MFKNMETKMTNRRAHLGCLVGAAWLAASVVASPLAWAQSFPSKPIKFVVPFGPGSGTDTSARYFGKKLQELTCQPVVV